MSLFAFRNKKYIIVSDTRKYAKIYTSIFETIQNIDKINKKNHSENLKITNMFKSNYSGTNSICSKSILDNITTMAFKASFTVRMIFVTENNKLDQN